MNPATALRAARLAAGLTQAQLAARASTAQANVSAYERGLRAPSVETLGRLLAAGGHRLVVERSAGAPVEPTRADHTRTARELAEVLALAAALPVRHEPQLAYPTLQDLEDAAA